MKQRLITVAVASALCGLAACQTTPETNALLSQAREAVTQAESDANVGKYAAPDLDRARKLLINAESAAKEKGANHEVTAHYAYLATQVARTAGQRAQEQLAISRIKAGETERQEILLTARETEANRAVTAARSAQADAERARSQAQNAQSQMAQAQAESQRLTAQLEELQAE